MKRTLIASLAIAAASAQASVTISDVSWTQNNATRNVEVSYQLGGTDERAIVTIDVLVDGVSIGGENIQYLSGDVNKVIEGNGAKKIVWPARKSWPDHIVEAGAMQIEVNAWALDNTPDYCVADLEADNTVRYYPAASFVPGGVTTNDDYKKTKLLLRRIHAKGDEWKMGIVYDHTASSVSRNLMHPALIDQDYYIGVFPLTVGQWYALFNWNIYGTESYVDAWAKPIAWGSYAEFRETEATKGTTTDANAVTFSLDESYRYPNAPHSGSALGKLRAKTGLAFDLPGEGEWEYACRACHYGDYYGDGSAILSSDKDNNLSRIAWNYHNTDNSLGNANVKRMQPVGQLAPNDFGLYDMNGNCWECCLDGYKVDITALNGQLCTDYSSGSMVDRGGGPHKNASGCHPSYRDYGAMNKRSLYLAFRPVVRIQ